MRTFWEKPIALLHRTLEGIFKRHSATALFLLCLVLLTVLTTILISRFPLMQIPEYKLGDTVRADIIAPRELIVVDPERTERLRAEEGRTVPPVFRYYPARITEATSALRQYFTFTREQFLTALGSTYGRRQLTRAEIARRDRRFRLVCEGLRAKDLPFPLSDELAAKWAQGENGEDTLARLESALRGVMSGYIRPDEQLPELARDQTGEVRLVPALTEQFEGLEKIEQHPRVRAVEVLTVAEARAALSRNLSPRDEQNYGDVLRSLIRVNCLFADDLTREARRAATERIVATNRYEPRQAIALRGEQVRPQTLAAIEALKSHLAQERSGRRFLGLMVIVAALYYALWRFAKRTRVYYLTPFKIFLLAAVTVAVQAFVVRIGLAISSGVAYHLGDFDSPEAYQYAIPYAAGALLVALLLESRMALAVGLITAILVGLITGDISTTGYALLGIIVAVYGVGRYQRRDTITRAGLIIGAGSVLATVVMALAKAKPIVFGPALFSSVCGMSSGLLTAALAAFALPINESLFGILTDVKLLELSNVELPLLKRLAIEAPGSYQHALIVATLAEAAAKAVNAHSLFVRVGSYYHDIGKLARPEMYVENQHGEANPHDLLPPEESARILMSHVAEGIRMGVEAGLPRQIIDLIPQHHGTRRLHYFYSKALSLAEKRGKPVDEKLFRYSGPKPQTIEAAIVMMCDSAEAASRSLKERTRENISLIVRKVIDDLVTDGQLDECNLRMKDLNVIRQTIIQTLGTLYHERVPYPGFTEQELAQVPSNYEGALSLESLHPARGGKTADLDLSSEESWPPSSKE